MSKLILLSMLLMGASVTTAQAAIVWQGEAVIDTATGQCGLEAAIAPATDRVLKTVLRPKNVSDNGANTTVTFVANQMAMFAMVLDHGAMPSGTAAAFGNTSSGVIKANVGVTYNGFSQSPATIAATDDNVTLQGTINDFLYVAGCTVTFRAAYSRRND